VVSSLNSPATSFAELDSTAGVVCYAPNGRNAGRPTCNVISLEGSDIQAGPDVVVDESLASSAQSTLVELTTVAGLSSTEAIMCYRSRDSTSTFGALRCAALTRTGSELTELEVKGSVLFDSPEAAFTYDVSVVGFSESMAMVCYSDNLFSAKVNQGGCSMLSISGDTLTVSDTSWMPLQATKFTESVVAQSLSSDTALVCFTEGSDPSNPTGLGVAGECIFVEVSASVATKKAELSITSGAISHMALKKFSDETAVLCYMTATQGTCVEIFASGSALTKGEPLVLDGANLLQHPAISSVSAQDGVVCYTGTDSGNKANWGKCVPVEVTPVSTGTGTSSSSTPHTTTETSSTSVTVTTETSSTGTSSTTPHTTTGTSSSTETATATTATTETTTLTTVEQVVSSGAVRIASMGAPMIAFLAARAVWNYA